MRICPCFLLIVLISLAKAGHINGLENFAETGACENVVTSKRRCAMQASDCEPTHIDGNLNTQGEKWHSAYRLKQRGFDACTCEDTEIGACMSINDGEASLNFSCAPTQTGYCNKGTQESFGSLSQGINEGYCGCASYGRSSSGIAEQTATRYGACQDLSSKSKHFCAYSPAACEENHLWVQPELTKQVIGTDCHCANVRIGGCIGGFENFHCAVTEDDCTWDDYFAPLSLKEKHGHTCNLCLASPINDEIDDIDQFVPSTDGGLLSAGGIAGIVIASIVGFVAIGTASYYFVYSYRTKKTEGIPIPIESPKSVDSSVDNDTFNEEGILG